MLIVETFLMPAVSLGAMGPVVRVGKSYETAEVLLLLTLGTGGQSLCKLDVRESRLHQMDLV